MTNYEWLQKEGIKGAKMQQRDATLLTVSASGAVKETATWVLEDKSGNALTGAAYATASTPLDIARVLLAWLEAEHKESEKS